MAKHTEPSAASLQAIPEIDFSRGVRGKYASRASNVFALDADLVGAFPDAKSVNDTLRAVLAFRRATSRSIAGPKRNARQRTRRSVPKRPGA
jgi:hypothetical protein